MPRVDIWETADAADAPAIDLGFPRGLGNLYRFGKQLGVGGFGSVRVVEDATGLQLACKSIKKRLEVPNVSPQQQQRHLDNIKREVAILRKLRGTLNVAHLEDVFEDDESVHIIMELCKGGELLHSLGKRPYSEGTVADYMRCVLRTLAQCHHFRILHRDIKPGNFMLLNEAEDAPLKAIDFGLAVFFDPKKLPIRDLGLEGTPWFMAPEMLSSCVGPSVDVWAAGVMAYQLLSGAFPFNDWTNVRSPALSRVWKSILTEEPKLTGSNWEGISDEAKSFIKAILVKDPAQRPSAKQALKHPWLAEDKSQRGKGKSISTTVVARLQRYGLGNAFKRTILDMITDELLHKHAAAAAAARQAEEAQQQQADGPAGQEQGQESGQENQAPPDGPSTSGVGDGAEARQETGSAGEPGSPSRNTFTRASVPARSSGAGAPPSGDKQARGPTPRQRKKALAWDLLRSGSSSFTPGRPLGNKALTVHAGSSAYEMLAAQGLKPSVWDRGPRLPSGAFVPPPMRGRHGSEAWWQGQAGNRPSTADPSGASVSAPGVPPVAEEGPESSRSSGGGGGGVGGQEAMALDSPLTPGVGSERLQSLRHYAFLMGVQEQTFNNMAKFQASGPTSTRLGPAQAQDLDKAGPSSQKQLPPSKGMGPKRNSSEQCMLKLLGSVQRQRHEHRKMQRLGLDTSGRGQQGYAVTAGLNEGFEATEEGQEDEATEEEEEAAAAAAAQARQQRQQRQQQMASSPFENRAAASPVLVTAQQEGVEAVPQLDVHKEELPAVHGSGGGGRQGLLGVALLQQQEAAAARRQGGLQEAQQAQQQQHPHQQHSLYQHSQQRPVASHVIMEEQEQHAASPPGSCTSSLANTRASMELEGRTSGGDERRRSQRNFLAFIAEPPEPIEAPQGFAAMELAGRGRGRQGYASLVAQGSEDGGAAASLGGLLTPETEGGESSPLSRSNTGMMAIRVVPKVHQHHAAWTGSLPTGSLLADQVASLTRRGSVGGGRGGSLAMELGGGQSAEESAHGGNVGARHSHHRSSAAAAHAAVVAGLNRVAEQQQLQQQQQQQQQQLGDSATPTGTSTPHAPAAQPPMSSDAMLSALAELMPSGEQLEELKTVLSRMQYDNQQDLSFSQISQGLQQLGYRLEPSEVELLLREVAGSSSTLSQTQFIASQVDWRAFQTNHRDEWLECLRNTFETMDQDNSGTINTSQIVELLGQKLPEGEVNLAVQEMLMDAAIGPEGIDFDDFCRLVREDSFDSKAGSSVHGLDLYDARFAYDAMQEHMQAQAPGLIDTVIDEADADEV